MLAWLVAASDGNKLMEKTVFPAVEQTVTAAMDVLVGQVLFACSVLAVEVEYASLRYSA